MARALFKKRAVLRHCKTGGRYVVLGLPEDNCLEAGGEPCYRYRAVDTAGPVWHRCVSEMEDARFIQIDKLPFFKFYIWRIRAHLRWRLA